MVARRAGRRPEDGVDVERGRRIDLQVMIFQLTTTTSKTGKNEFSSVIKINKWSNNFEERPHRTSCRYWGLNNLG